MDFNLNPAYIYDLMSSNIVRGQNTNHYFAHSCNRPHKTLSIDSYCNVMLCSCSGWLPLPVGKITDFDTFEDVWNCDRAKYIQQDIEDKKFSYCAVEHCGIINQNIQESVYQIALGIDDSCNLACPSCRREQIMHTQGFEFDKRKAASDHVVEMLAKFDKPVVITLSGTGDPLASHIYRAFLKTYEPKPTQRFILKTNGLLIKKQLENSKLFSANMVLSISVDAGSKRVYENIRRPARWESLIENFEFLKSKNKTAHLNFCIQKNNYLDLPAFVELCKQYNFIGNVHQLDDWGTWNRAEVETPDTWTIANGHFLQHDVLNKSHPEYQGCKEICNNIIAQNLNYIKFGPAVLTALGPVASKGE